MTKQLFLTFDEFNKSVADSRGGTIAMDDINMMFFHGILYDSLSDEYLAKVRLKDEYRSDYRKSNNFVMMENTHLLHWAEWLDIGIIIKNNPSLIDYAMVTTEIDMSLKEPCFIEQPMEYNIKILLGKHKDNRHEFIFLNRIKQWAIITVEYILIDKHIDVCKHYYNKHGRR